MGIPTTPKRAPIRHVYIWNSCYGLENSFFGIAFLVFLEPLRGNSEDIKKAIRFFMFMCCFVEITFCISHARRSLRSRRNNKRQPFVPLCIYWLLWRHTSLRSNVSQMQCIAFCQQSYATFYIFRLCICWRFVLINTFTSNTKSSRYVCKKVPIVKWPHTHMDVNELLKRYVLQ